MHGQSLALKEEHNNVIRHGSKRDTLHYLDKTLVLRGTHYTTLIRHGTKRDTLHYLDKPWGLRGTHYTTLISPGV